MAIEHNVIPEAGLHEIKGASTASAGEVPIADGLGSAAFGPVALPGESTTQQFQYYTTNAAAGTGAWEYVPHGWGFYADTASSPATIVYNTTPAKLQIDGGGGTSESSYLPPEIRGSAELWDVVNDKITPVAVGDSYDMRINLTISATSGTPNYLILELDIGGSASPTNVISTQALPMYKTAPFDIVVSLPIFTLGTFLANGGQVFLSTDTGTATVSDRSIFISRNARGNV